MSKARQLADFISDSTVETAEIADGAVTAGKLNVTGNGTSGQALTSDADGSFSWTTITSDLVDDASPQLGANLDTNGNDITFGDNDKAIFGAGSDLQIYHDGTHSYLDNTTGTLYLRNYSDDKDVSIQSDNGSGGLTTYVLADGSAGEVRLYHYTSEKFHTTSSGVNVIGTVTADGLTVGDSHTLGNDAFDNLQISASSGEGLIIRTVSNSDATLKTQDIQRLRVGGTGDISFYEDTGTTPKLFWDASTERLGIGTSSPARQLEIYDDGTNGQAVVAITAQNTDTSAIFFADTDDTNIGGLQYAHSTNSLAVRVNDETRMTIDSSGNVGIGTTSPSYPLHISKSGDANSVSQTTSTSGEAQFFVRNPISDGGLAGSLIYGSAKAAYGALGSNEAAYYSNRALTIMSDTGSGIIKFATGGNTERMRINASGNVGIGTSSPSHPLHVLATAAGQTTVKFESNQAGAMNVALDVDTDRDCLLQFQEAGTTRWDIFMNGSSGTNPLLIRDDGGTTQGSFDQSGNFKFNSGFGSAATAYGCRAWVTFNGTGTPAIRASGNVSTITDNGTGDYSTNFITAMPDTNYCVVMASGANSYNEVFNKTNDSNFTTSLARVLHLEREVLTDSTYMHFALFR